MLYVNTLAIVLKKEEKQEIDTSFIFYTKKFGKLNVFAKGAKKINAKLSPHLLVANLVRMELVIKSYPRLIGAELKDNFSFIRKNDFALWSTLENLYIFDQLIVSPEKDLKIWNLLLNYLNVSNFLLKKGKGNGYLLLVSLFFKINLISLLGYSLSLEALEKNTKITDKQKKIVQFLVKKDNYSELFSQTEKKTDYIYKKNEEELKKLNLNLKKYLKKVVPYIIDEQY